MSLEAELISYFKNLLYNADVDYDVYLFLSRMLLYGLGFGLGIGMVFFNYSIELSLLSFLLVFVIFEAAAYALILLAVNRRIAAIEEALPDFLSMVAGNIRSGLTYDQALMLSTKKEFGPLASEIDIAAKETISGKPLPEVLMNMAVRIRSESFSKTMRLIVEGLNSGGNLAELLENTSLNIQRFSAVRKEVSATVLVYQLFVFSAAGFGAPLLFSVSEFLVRTVAQLRESIGADAADSTQLPFFASASALSPDAVFWFSIIAIVITCFFGALAGGVISKGKESEGLKYFPALFFISMMVFFAVRILLETALGQLFVG